MNKINYKIFCLTFLVALALFCASLASADEGVTSGESQPASEDVAQERCLKSIEFLTGFGWNKLKAKTVAEEKRSYNIFPLIVDFDFNLKNLTKKIGFNPPGLVEFQLEPYIAPVSSPSANVEVGGQFMFKFGILPETSKFQPFVKVGAGMTYMTLHTVEQGTQYNFIETGAVGAHFYFTKNTSLVVEGRIRHLSNAGIDEPNSGFNTYLALAGISYKY